MGEKGQFRRRIPAVKLWLVWSMTLAFFIGLLVAAHITHSLTLRVEAYHGFYNLLSLTGCLLTMKLCSRPESLHNTFGWARLEVLSMLTTLIFLTALCFSVAIDSIQTAVHAGHQDAMHHPLHIMGLGVVGLILNGIVYCLIGGYTHHQGCFLEIRGSGGVWVGKQLTEEAVQTGRRMLSSGNLNAGSAKPPRTHERLKEVMRDITGLILVELCAAVVHWDNGEKIALYIDPALAVTSVAVLMWLSYPYGRECCQILLQTIPGHINVEEFQNRILDEFPAILNVHHLHIWTFTPSKVIATAHVVFPNPRVYLANNSALKEFFLDEGVTQVTLQPEYASTKGSCTADNLCLLRCENHQCHERECCRECTSEIAPLTAVYSGKGSTTPSKSTDSATTGTSKEEENVCLTFTFPEGARSAKGNEASVQDTTEATLEEAEDTPLTESLKNIPITEVPIRSPIPEAPETIPSTEVPRSIPISRSPKSIPIPGVIPSSVDSQNVSDTQVPKASEFVCDNIEKSTEITQENIQSNNSCEELNENEKLDNTD